MPNKAYTGLPAASVSRGNFVVMQLEYKLLLFFNFTHFFPATGLQLHTQNLAIIQQ